MGRKHIWIPDLQVKPGVPLNHCDWIGRYIKEKEPDVVINGGDMADLPSLSEWDKKTFKAEGRRYEDDVQSVIYANSLLWDSIVGTRYWSKLETHIVLGNHEDRITRYTNKSPELHGALSISDLQYEDYYDYVHPFLKPVVIDGVTYTHYFYTPNTGKPLGGVASTRLKNIGFSFTMGHQQGVDYAMRHLSNGTTQHGLIAGSAYIHDEDYKGPQANDHWRGIIMKYGVEKGAYDAKFVSLDSLCQRYENMYLKEFIKAERKHIIY